MDGIQSEIDDQQDIIDAGNEGEDDYDNAVIEKERLEGVYGEKETELGDAQDAVDALYRAQELDDAAIAGANFQRTELAFEEAEARVDRAYEDQQEAQERVWELEEAIEDLKWELNYANSNEEYMELNE